MKRATRIIILAAFIITGFFIGCGGGSNTDHSSLTTITEDTSPLAKENYYAQQFVSATIEYGTAKSEGKALIRKTLGDDWQNAKWTGDSIFAYLGEEKAIAFTKQLVDINEKKIRPALDKIKIYSDKLNKAEAELNTLLSLGLGAKGKTNPRFFLLDDFFIAGTILVAITAAFTAEAIAVTTVVDDAHTGDPIKDLGKTVSTWTKAADKGLKSFITSAGESLTWAGASALAEANKLKDFATTIDVVSTGKSIKDGISDFIGIKDCSNLYNEKKAIDLNRMLAAVRNSDPATLYIGRTDAARKLYNVPEGEWAFVAFEDGYARSAVCVNVQDNTTEVHLQTEPIKYFHETILDDDKDGYSEEQGDCNDHDKALYPTAVEKCNDGIDNNCDGQTDCNDESCKGEVICQEEQSSSSPSTSTGISMISATVSIPGYGMFQSNSTLCTFGAYDDSPNLYPACIASTNSNIFSLNPYSDDILTLFFNTSLKKGGTYSFSKEVSDNWSVDLFFSTPRFKDSDGNLAAFGSISGTVTLTQFGTAVGDKIAGTFTAVVEGHPGANGTVQGNISGSFNGILEKPITKSPTFIHADTSKEN